MGLSKVDNSYYNIYLIFLLMVQNLSNVMDTRECSGSMQSSDIYPRWNEKELLQHVVNMFNVIIVRDACIYRSHRRLYIQIDL